MREAPRAGHRAKGGKCSGSLTKRVEAVPVVARHPHAPPMGPGGVEQAQELGAEPTRSGGLPHASHALGSSGVAETEQQRRRVATSRQ